MTIPLPVRLLTSLQAVVVVVVVLLFIGPVHASVNSGTSPQQKKSPLHKVYHEKLFSKHDLATSDSVHLLAQSHMDAALQSNPTQPLPFLLCGPSESVSTLEHKEQQIRALVGSDVVHVARDISDGDAQEVCFLVHASPRDMLELTR